MDLNMHDHHMMDTTTTMMDHDHHHNHHHHQHNNMSSMMNMTANNTGGSGGGDHGMHGMGGMGHDGMDGHGGMGMGHMDKMKMYFHTGVKEYILFESCHTENDTDIIIACLVMFFVAVLYEGLKFMREVLLQRTLKDRSRMYFPDNKLSTAGNSQEQMVIRGSTMSVSSQMLSSGHAIQTFLHIIQVFLSYCLMLVFMTYNVWLCISVILGAGIGYFVFGWKRAVVVDANEHCH